MKSLEPKETKYSNPWLWWWSWW